MNNILVLYNFVTIFGSTWKYDRNGRKHKNTNIFMSHILPLMVILICVSRTNNNPLHVQLEFCTLIFFQSELSYQRPRVSLCTQSTSRLKDFQLNGRKPFLGLERPLQMTLSFRMLARPLQIQLVLKGQSYYFEPRLKILLRTSLETSLS